jgi:hypothetical protein
MKPKMQFLSAMLLLFIIVACTNNFDELNRNPASPAHVPDGSGSKTNNMGGIDIDYEISNEELEELKTVESTIGTQFRNFSYEGLYNDYQRTTNLTHDIYAGYFANNHPGFVVNSPNYVYTSGWSDLRWTHFYVDRTKEYASLIRTFWFLDKKKYNNAFYITRIYYAFIASTMTDTYGDMPFSAVVKGLPAPKETPYDTQEEVYNMIFEMLEQAVDNIRIDNNAYNFGDDDRCFGGDEEKWVRFANTLRLRLALRLSNIDPARARKEGEKALMHSGGLMRSNDDNMKIIPKYAPIDMGGEGAGGDENIYTLVSYTWLDVCMSKDIETFYKNQSAELDPRCLVQWFRPTPKRLLEDNKEILRNDYKGCEIGNDNVEQDSRVYSILRSNTKRMDGKTLYDTHWFGNSREVVWMSYAESLFLQAEASLREWSGVLQLPRDNFENGIRASMEYYRINSAQIDSYINNLHIFTGDNPFTGTNREAMLEQIITQKWLAVFPNGNEGWAEFRRTDYPALNTHWNSKDTDIPNGKFIKRIRYPGNEYDENKDNVPMDVHQGTRLWWDVEDTNDSNGERLQPNNFRSALKFVIR